MLMNVNKRPALNITLEIKTISHRGICLLRLDKRLNLRLFRVGYIVVNYLIGNVAPVYLI